MMDPERKAAWENIPWYINGTLSSAERRRLEAHLDQCPLLRAELAEQSRLQSVLREADTADAHEAESWRRLQAQIAPRPRRPAVTWGIAAWAAGGLVAASLALVVITPGLREASGPNDFVTLSTPDAQPAALRILPAPGADPAEIAALLAEHGLERLTGSPTSELIRARPSAESPPDVETLLRDHPAIAFVASVGEE